MKAINLAVELKGLAKSFGAVQANAGVDLRIRAGSIHGIVGENGAGKSTAMKMLYGVYAPDSGEILVNGISRSWRTPADAIRAGVGMVHQHFMLAGPYTVLENIVLGTDCPPRAGVFGAWVRFLPRALRSIDWAAARSRLDEIARQYKLPVEWDLPIDSLPVGIQQRVEILKLLYRDAKILILDEPTAVLTPAETDALFVQLRHLRDEGKTILIITHKLREVMSLTDRVTVFRAGRVTGEVETSQTSPEQLAELMVGRKVLLRAEAPTAPPPGAPVLEVRGLSLEGATRGSRNKLDQVSFSVRSGEIVGIAGVEGNGQSELIQAVFHSADSQCRSGGEVRVLGADATQMTTSQIRERGVGVIPEDRHREGLLLEFSVVENFALGLHRRAPFRSAAGRIDWSAVRAATERAIAIYDIRPKNCDVAVGGLSGGNQQKLIIAREFEAQPKLLIAAQPTRGVDVGAIEFIHQQIFKARSEGAGVLLISSELDEVLALSDRIFVMYEGRIAGEFARGECTEHSLGMRMSGAEVHA